MENIRIQTTQNVVIHYELANIGDRILATLIDSLVVLAWLILAGISMASFQRGNATAVVILLLPFLLYDLISEIFMDGQSIGKRSRNIKVVNLDGSEPSVSAYLLRWLLRPLEIMLSSGAIAMVTIIWNQRGQRLGDILAGTTVIKLAKRITLEDTLFADIDERYQPVIRQVGALDAADVEIVKEVLKARQAIPEAKKRNALLRRARLAIEKRLGITSELGDETFLETVLKDYNAITGT